MDWIKFYTSKWLFGSGRNMTPEKRGVWADFMALAAETKLRDGTLRFDVGQPMPREYIASVLRIPPETLDACIDVFAKDLNTDDHHPRIKIWDDGTIELTNWERFQGRVTFRKDKTKSSELGNVPLDSDERKKSQELMATKLGYMQPEAAQKGIERRHFEEQIKQVGRQ